MTEISATRCLKILCKFSFVAKSTWRHKYITNHLEQMNFSFLTNHIWSYTKAFGYKLTLITSVSERQITVCYQLNLWICRWYLCWQHLQRLLECSMHSLSLKQLGSRMSPSNTYTYCQMINYKFTKLWARWQRHQLIILNFTFHQLIFNVSWGVWKSVFWHKKAYFINDEAVLFYLTYLPW